MEDTKHVTHLDSRSVDLELVLDLLDNTPWVRTRTIHLVHEADPRNLVPVRDE